MLKKIIHKLIYWCMYEPLYKKEENSACKFKECIDRPCDKFILNIWSFLCSWHKI